MGQKVYTPSVDIWSVGTIFAEMLLKKALWRGDSEIGQLFKVFRTLGTPTEEVWPGVTTLPDYGASFPRWPAKSLAKVFPMLDAAGVDLMEVCMCVCIVCVCVCMCVCTPVNHDCPSPFPHPQRMLRYNPSDRISAKKALLHPFFSDVDTTTHM